MMASGRTEVALESVAWRVGLGWAPLLPSCSDTVVASECAIDISSSSLLPTSSVSFAGPALVSFVKYVFADI